MNDQSHVAAHEAASAAAPSPGGDTPRFVRATVQEVDQTHYLLTVKIGNDPGKSGVSYNPLAYIPRTEEPVLLAVLGQDPKNWWVMGVASSDMFNKTDVGRTPSAALRRDSNFNVEHATDKPVQMTAADWDTDNMIPDTISAAGTTKITPQRTGLYTIKAGGRWNPATAGRRIMKLRWAGTNEIIALDEKGPNDGKRCAHSVSVDVMITDASDSRSPLVRILTNNPAVELVVHQTSGSQLALLPDVFLQMTYQGPKP